MISLIVAMDRKGLIGSNGSMPWRIKSELQHFQKITTGGICIFGRKTWESLPEKPLSNRINVVISGNMYPNYNPLIFPKLYQALSECCYSFPNREIFICGGSSLYKEALPFADRVYLSCIWGDYEGDTFFPCVPWELMYDKGFTITEEYVGENQLWDFYRLDRFP